MKAARFHCLHCRCKQTAKKVGQRYCGSKDCQAARKRKWSKDKYADDPDYRLNQKESTASWLESQGGAAQYYRDYRRRKREEQNGLQKILPESAAPSFIEPSKVVAMAAEQEEAKATTRIMASRPSCASLFGLDVGQLGESANSDAMDQDKIIKPGIYRIFPLGANRDAIMAEIRVIASG